MNILEHRQLVLDRLNALRTEGQHNQMHRLCAAGPPKHPRPSPTVWLQAFLQRRPTRPRLEP